MTYSTVTNPVWVNAEHTAITCTVDFDSHGSLPFTASADDVVDYGREIFSRCAAGEFGPVGDYAAPPAPPPPPEPTKADLMAQIQALMAKVEALP